MPNFFRTSAFSFFVIVVLALLSAPIVDVFAKETTNTKRVPAQTGDATIIAGTTADLSRPDIEDVITFSEKDLTPQDENLGTPVAATIKTRAALKAYTRMIVAADPRIKSITTSEYRTDVVARQQAKLFAFIPMWLTVSTAVMADHSATVHYPWFTFLTKPLGGRITPAQVIANAMLSSETTLSPNDQADVVYGMMKAMTELTAEKTVTSTTPEK